MGAWILFLIFCIPAIIAWVRDHSSRTAITILSLLNALFLEVSSIFGLFFGLILLLWAIIGRSVQKPTVVIEEKKAEEKKNDDPSLFAYLKEKKPDSVSVEGELTSSPSPSLSNMSIAEELTKLAELKENGFLTAEEFEKTKQKLLNQ